MSIDKWLADNSSSIKGKTVAITGSTGGLGREICKFLASLGANLCLLDRNEKTSEEHRSVLLAAYPDIIVTRIRVNLENMDDVRQAVKELSDAKVDIFIHNAGAYSIPRHKCSTGFDNVYQINFVSPYYMIRELMPVLSKNHGRVIVVGSIAHNYSVIDKDDIDFSTTSAASKVYGNAKRYLMFSLYELFKDESCVKLSVTHPGITLTNITAHYPKLIYAIIKHPMKIIFMSPRRAALCIVKGVFDDCSYCEWIGPRVFNVWGLPEKKKLRTCKAKEIKEIAKIAETVYSGLKND